MMFKISFEILGKKLIDFFKLKVSSLYIIYKYTYAYS